MARSAMLRALIDQLQYQHTGVYTTHWERQDINDIQNDKKEQ